MGSFQYKLRHILMTGASNIMEHKRWNKTFCDQCYKLLELEGTLHCVIDVAIKRYNIIMLVHPSHYSIHHAWVS